MTDAEVARFQKIQAQLQGLYEETAALSKKKPDDALNKFKLRLVNTVLSEANQVVGDSYRPFADFANFEEDDLPTNSDVAVMVSQYLNCLENMRADNIKQEYRQWYWIVEGRLSDIRTGPPKGVQD